MQDKQIKIIKLIKLLENSEITNSEREDIAQDLSELGYSFVEIEPINDKPF